MEWLRPVDTAGLPDEFLYSVLRARRSRLCRDTRSLELRAQETQPAWAGPLREASWVYGRMNKHLARAFAPFFSYLGLKLLLVLLRFRPGTDPEAEAALGRAEFLCPQLRHKLEHQKNQLETARLISGLLAENRTAEVLVQRLATEGERSFEAALTDLFLQRLRNRKLVGEMDRFFADLIDLRNLMALYKKFRWNLQEAPAPLPGGRLSPERLKRMAQSADPARLLREADRLAGGFQIQDEKQLEVALLRALTRRLRFEGRDPLGKALILDYLWGCYLEGRNLSLARAAAEAGTPLPSEELIL